MTAATDAIFKALDAVPNRHVAMGVYGPAEVAPWYARGCRFFFYSSDTAILYNAVRGLTDAFHETVAAAAAPDKAKRSAG